MKYLFAQKKRRNKKLTRRINKSERETMVGVSCCWEYNMLKFELTF